MPAYGPASADRAGRHPGPRGGQPGHRQFGRQPGQVGEPGREAAERHPELGAGEPAHHRRHVGTPQCPATTAQVRAVEARPGSRPVAVRRRRRRRRRRRQPAQSGGQRRPGRARRRAGRCGAPGTISTASSSPARGDATARPARPRTLGSAVGDSSSSRACRRRVGSASAVIAAPAGRIIGTSGVTECHYSQVTYGAVT